MREHLFRSNGVQSLLCRQNTECKAWQLAGHTHDLYRFGWLIRGLYRNQDSVAELFDL